MRRQFHDACFAACVCVLSLLFAGGCMYIKQGPRGFDLRSASPAQGLGDIVADSAWPDLLPDGLPTYAEEHTDTLKLDVSKLKVEHIPAELSIRTVRHAGTLGPAWVRWSRFTAGVGTEPEPDRPSSFDVFFWNSSDVPPEGMVNGCIAGLVPDDGTNRRRGWIDATKRLRINYQVMLPERRPIRGVVLYGASLGPQYDLPVVTELLARGWAVVGCSSATISTDRLLNEVIDLRDRGEAALREYGVLAAGECDKVLAGYAYGWEVALEMVERYYPEIPTHPCVMAGFSFGAIMTPPGAARLGHRVDAAVLVGGGTNLLGILTETPVINFPIRVRDAKGVRRATPVELDRINQVYLEHAQLDGHRTARALAGKSVLMLHAELDGWVPAKYGRDLWEQAGRPERWRGPFGHMLMFYFLGHQARPIADWVDRATASVRVCGGGE